MFAVVKSGSKQYKVEKGTILTVEKIDKEIGSTIDLDTMLLSLDDELVIDPEKLQSMKVSAKIVDHGKADKILTIKHRRRKNYRKKIGHRQSLTKIEIVSIN